ncbi:MAG: class I SAM-dependent methyltransferase [Rhodospirillaceae bacterium]|jgi:predicted O-methyltransferase YrrM|nr:class I SAM-dependent methyltransferase [Rhodospirillaceae bacterium]MBT4588247.1 class I SAM-dependent methyltransferase [Rhodospirillaceae bacterium]MBT5941229.1 class I SAM-dependent methyltransferase [Rhodospirillaceae bacterium]
MLRSLKRFANKLLAYQPLPGTVKIRRAIDDNIKNGLPYCPAYEGDLIFSIIQTNKYCRFLETGFHTGSTALYMAAAGSELNAQTTSICLDDDEGVERGLRLLQNAGYSDQHRLIRKNSNVALPELFLAGESFDFIFMDGWKTFDHLAFEMYYFNQLLETGGVISFDDSYMPSVRKAIKILTHYYGYEEVDYAAHNQNFRLRLYQVMTRRSPYRPYRALIKKRDIKDQSAFRDWNFYRTI